MGKINQQAEWDRKLNTRLYDLSRAKVEPGQSNGLKMSYVVDIGLTVKWIREEKHEK